MVYATMRAPGCSVDCNLETSLDALVITARIKEPVNKGKRVRESICEPATTTLNPGT
jgi:hypothetical protein